MWKGLPENVRTEVVAQLARLIVNSLIRADESRHNTKRKR
jgi:hypothetical protein